MVDHIPNTEAQADLTANGHRPLDALTHEDYLHFLLGSFDVRDPATPPTYTLLYTADTKARLQRIKEEAPELYHGVFEVWVNNRRDLFWPNVERALEADPTPPMIVVPHVALPLAPRLPMTAMLPPQAAEGAAPWLEAYCAYSRQWSPRAADGFHQGIGLWMLSTVAAGRVCVYTGSRTLPVLFIAMVAPSSRWAKTTTAKLGRTGLIDSGCGYLLAPDRSTPQALVKRMAGRVPEDFGAIDEAEQATLLQHLAFAGQCGWYYEEWGGMLHQMTRRDSPIAEFHGLLRILDEGEEKYDNNTIMRGLEQVTNPYLALLASATPADLQQFMKPGSAWWHDGFWPRFAFLTPSLDEQPSKAQRPWGRARLSSALIVALHTWHTRLGMPTLVATERRDAQDRRTGQYKGTLTPVTPQDVEPSGAVKAAYDAYNGALMDMVNEDLVSSDLSGSYYRFHDKAIRVALLLASIAGSPTIELCHWAYAQQVTEAWRLMLHGVVELAERSQPMSREEALEEKIENVLARGGAMSARDMRRHIFHCNSIELNRLLHAMVLTGRLISVKKSRTDLYMLPVDAPPPGEDEEGEQYGGSDTPF